MHFKLPTGLGMSNMNFLEGVLGAHLLERYQDKKPQTNPPGYNPPDKNPLDKNPLAKNPPDKNPPEKLMNTKYILHK